MLALSGLRSVAIWSRTAYSNFIKNTFTRKKRNCINPSNYPIRCKIQDSRYGTTIRSAAHLGEQPNERHSITGNAVVIGCSRKQEVVSGCVTMESLGEEPWDVVVCGTGLQQSLLALALSRSKKRILHLDPRDYYGQHEAAFSLEEADSWATAHAPASSQAQSTAAPAPEASTTIEESTTNTSSHAAVAQSGIFRNAVVWKHPAAEATGLSFSRSYSLALAPQIIHTRSKLLAQLVSSKAFRQVDFLAVGSFFVCEKTGDEAARLSRIPSSREDVFSAQSIPAKMKRSLMKFLKFVIDFDADEQKAVWEAQASTRLVDFLASYFKLDADLQRHILALTLTLDGQITVEDGLAAINRHLSSYGVFGPGFCAVYPKWGGLSEIAQVACRSGAVGGAVYMLDTGMEVGTTSDQGLISLNLTNGLSIATGLLVSSQDAAPGQESISRLVAIVKSPLNSLFDVVTEGAPVPAVAVVALPSNVIPGEDTVLSHPIYAMIHTSETGECPKGQYNASRSLEQALGLLLEATGDDEISPCLYKLYYEQSISKRSAVNSPPRFSFASLPLGLAFNDNNLDDVKAAWKMVMGDDVLEDEYMVFEDREGAEGDDEMYD
ncbi:GDP dissociation inhibitor-domain-containing protein [Xylariales sp. PMI_506]|nr:GDP dissociation inhibitor-domain-containing protein [Xylariales sp. PMI_506]